MKNFSNILRLSIVSCFLLILSGCSTDTLMEDNLNKGLTQEVDLDAHAKNNTWSTSLKGGNEVPAVNTNAAGHATVKLSKDGNSLYYKITVGNIVDVTQAHLHMAPAGSNGGVVAFLYGFIAEPTGRTNGILAEGTITSSDLLGNLTGASLQDLVEAIDNGMIYVNVHTIQVPSGELRGQL